MNPPDGITDRRKTSYDALGTYARIEADPDQGVREITNGADQVPVINNRCPSLSSSARKWCKWSAASLLILLTLVVFVWNVRKNYFLGDDCYISFRYAQHLYEGHGLVWNPGEYVEGYTNFFWVILMAFGLLWKIPPEVFSNVIGIASGVLIMLSLAGFSSRHSGINGPWVIFLLLVLSMSKTFTGWCTGGLATMFHAMLIFGAFLAFLEERRNRTRYPVVSAMLFALSALTRPDALLFVLVAGIFFAVDVLLKRRKLTSLWIWATPLIVIVGTHFAWRYAYYGYWLPNSFYAKVNGIWWEQGLRYLSLFHEDYKILYFLPLIPFLLIVRRTYAHTLFLSIITAYLGYIIIIGGDRFEFRFLVCLFPFLYWLLVEGICSLAQLPCKGKGARYAVLGAGCAIAGALLVCTYTGSIQSRARDFRHGITSIRGIESYAERRVREGKFLRSLVDEGLLPDDLLIGVKGAGAVPYYSRLPALDLFGLNDVEIAHTPVTDRGLIAHEKMASRNYMLRRNLALCEVRNRIVYDHPWKIQDFDHYRRGRLVSLRAGDKYLNFKTFLPEKAFREIFGKLAKARGPLSRDKKRTSGRTRR